MHDITQIPGERHLLAAALERAAGAIARLDSAIAHHPLAPAWRYRALLEAIRRQSAVDGQIIDPWHLAALIEGVRFRLDAPAMIDRGVVFAAAHHAFGLYRWFVKPDQARRAAIAEAAAHLEGVGDTASTLLGAALVTHSWLDKGGERAPLRAALPHYWVRRRIISSACPLLTGVGALAADIPWNRDAWIGHFFEALAAEGEHGLALLRDIERHWFAARHAVAGRRRDSSAAAAVDILAAAPLISATSLAQVLGIAIKNATRLLDGFVVLGIASEITHRSKRRLYGLKHLAPLREAAAPPRRPLPGRRRGRPNGAPIHNIEADAPHMPLSPVPSPPLPPLKLRAFDFTELDQLLDLTDQAIRRAQQVLKAHHSTPA